MTRQELECLEPCQWLDDKVNSHSLIMPASPIVRERLNDRDRYRDTGRDRDTEPERYRDSKIETNTERYNGTEPGRR